MRGSGSVAPRFLTSTLDRSKWSASRLSRINPGESVSGTHCLEVWVGPRARLDNVEYRIISYPFRKSNPGHPARRYAYSAIPSPLWCRWYILFIMLSSPDFIMDQYGWRLVNNFSFLFPESCLVPVTDNSPWCHTWRKEFCNT